MDVRAKLMDPVEDKPVRTVQLAPKKFGPVRYGVDIQVVFRGIRQNTFDSVLHCVVVYLALTEEPVAAGTIHARSPLWYATPAGLSA